MKYLLFFLALLAGLSAMAISVTAKTSIHEIYGGVLWLIASVLFGSSAIVSAVDAAANKVVEALEAQTAASEPRVVTGSVTS